MTRRTMAVGLLTGLLLNIVGWLGNQLVLGRLWRTAISTVAPLRERSWVNEVVSLVPDFVYGVALAWLFVVLVGAGRGRATAAAQAAMTTYLGIWNSGLLPGQLAAATTILAFVTFIPGAWLVWKTMP